MVRHEVHHAYHTPAAGYAHVHLHAVGTALVDGHQVLRLVHTIVHHLGRNQLILAQELQFVALHHRRVLRQVGIESLQLVHLPFQIEIAGGEFLVGLREGEELRGLTLPLVDLTCHGIG